MFGWTRRAFLMHVCILIVLVASPVNTFGNQSYALAFLTWQPANETIRFAAQLASDIPSIDVHIVVDDDRYSIPTDTASDIQFLQFDETVCLKYGFLTGNTFGTDKDCSAWDKALYYFSRANHQYDFVWFFEHDVFIPSTQAFRAVHELYAKNSDLVSAKVKYNRNGDISSWFHAYLLETEFVLPWSYAMVCALGVSRRVLSAVNEYAQWRGHIAFIEFLFHTLALHKRNMIVVTPTELSTIVYRKAYIFRSIKQAPNNWWHPVKNLSEQEQWRDK
jgi:hypothetical protein